jgi:hypothetical protein
VLNGERGNPKVVRRYRVAGLLQIRTDFRVVRRGSTPVLSLDLFKFRLDNCIYTRRFIAQGTQLSE